MKNSGCKTAEEIEEQKTTDLNGFPIPLNLVGLLSLGLLHVTGSQSYDNNRFMPIEACNGIKSSEAKFGGLKMPG